MPDKMPDPGQPVKLKPALRENGWVGDFDPIGSWNPIAPAKEGKLKEAKYPVWFPDEYAAWSWRAYHSSCTDLKITGPRHPYSKIDGKWGGNGACGLGYGGYLSASETHVLSAIVKEGYEKVLFHDGNKVLGETKGPLWALPPRKLQPGLRVLFAVGIKADGSRSASRPAMVIVK